MVLLILKAVTFPLSFILIYIPLWFYLYAPPHSNSPINYIIYIPLWFYLYKVRNQSIRAAHIFTFHYGSTYTHYVHIISPSNIYLHSTMVLLILHGGRKRRKSAPFTFHYGSTYTHWSVCYDFRSRYLHSTMVLLIRLMRRILSMMEIIYIPLWFYLYLGTHFIFFYISKIYIPLWFYLYKILSFPF